jgi:hypothetical protein
VFFQRFSTVHLTYLFVCNICLSGTWCALIFKDLWASQCIIVQAWHCSPDSHLFLFGCNKIIITCPSFLGGVTVAHENTNELNVIPVPHLKRQVSGRILDVSNIDSSKRLWEMGPGREKTGEALELSMNYNHCGWLVFCVRRFAHTSWRVIIKTFNCISRVTMWGVSSLSLCVVTGSRSQVCGEYDHVIMHVHKCKSDKCPSNVKWKVTDSNTVWHVRGVIASDNVSDSTW